MRTEDGCIIQDCLNGKPEAFGMLVDKYKEGVYAFVYAQLRDFQDAQDVTQEVFLQAYRDLRSLRRWESFCFWIYRIAHRCCAQCFRTRAKRVDREFIDDQAPNLIDAPSLESYRADKLGESVREALDSLPEAYQEVLLLHYFGGMTSRDIAEALGISPMAVLKRLSRARAQLKKEMIAMMGTAFHEQRLRTGFTFRIVESVKRVKIHPMPRIAGLPWGLSAAVGIIITVLSLNPHISIPSDLAMPTGLPLPVETKVLKIGEIPVDILKTSEISVIASKQGDGDGGKPQRDPQNALMLAPHADGDTWTDKTDMPTPRWGLAASVVNGKVYVIGGNAGPGAPGLSTVEEYDPETDNWTTKADMPTPRLWLSTSVVDGLIYAIGGASVGGNAPGLSTVEVYDPATDSWTTKADMPTARCYLSTGVVEGKIYAIGGSGSINGTGLAVVEMYDPATDKWTKKSDIPRQGVVSMSTGVVNGVVYVIGGAPVAGAVVSTVHAYNPATDKWTEKAPMPTKRGLTSTSTVDGKIYVIGGIDGIALSAVEVYDPATDTWIEKTDMPGTRLGLSSGAVNGKIYAIGGVSLWLGPGVSTLEEYDTGFVISSTKPNGKLIRSWGEIKSD